MKRILILLALSVTASFATSQAVDYALGVVDFKMAIVRPRPGVDYKLLVVAPDPRIDFKLGVVDPGAGRMPALPRRMEDRLRRLFERHVE
jgi:hypothetical protein